MTNVSFYASADEQRRWISDLILPPDVWCWLWTWSTRSFREFHPNDIINSVPFVKRERESVSLYLGNVAHTKSPVWRYHPGGWQDIDFAASQAIQFNPSMTWNNEVLLEGHIGVLARHWYTDAGIDATPLHAWFKEVAASFRKLRDRQAVLIHHTTLGATKRLRSVVLTPGAVQWRNEGGRLKQFPNGPVEFEVEITSE